MAARETAPSITLGRVRSPHAVRCALALGLACGLGLVSARAVHAAADPMRTIAIAEDERRLADGVLLGFLKDGSPAVRARAVLAIGRLQDSTAVPKLLPLLEDPAPQVRREVVFALGQIGHRSARDRIEALLSSPDTALVDLSIEALGKLGDKSATPNIAACLRRPSSLLRGEAAVALWRLADSTALEPLLAHHDDPDPEVRWRVLYALEKIVAPDRIAVIAALHLDDPEWLVRAYAARTLGRQKSTRGTAYLLQKLADPEPAVVVNALRGLQSIADSTCAGCAGRLLLGALGHSHPYVRVSAATAFADRWVLVSADSVVRRTLIDSLAAHLRDPDAATRGACARALIAIRGAAAVPAVEPLLSDSSLYTRVAVLQAMTTLPPALAAPMLRARLDAKAPLFERMTAAEGLGTLKAREFIPLLREGLADTSALYLASCASALADMGDSASLPVLSRAYAARANDADADARIALRDAVRALGGAAAADSLERAHPAGRIAKPDYPADFEKPSPVRGAILHTSAGDIEWAFYGAEATQTVKNFVRLAERGYFNGLSVHRVVPNFVIQDGDPTGTGSGGPGYTIRCEYNHLRYDTGMVGMALSGKDTGGSQWFITLSPQHHLNGRYTIFARVTRGLEVARSIVQGDRVLQVDLVR